MEKSHQCDVPESSGLGLRLTGGGGGLPVSRPFLPVEAGPLEKAQCPSHSQGETGEGESMCVGFVRHEVCVVRCVQCVCSVWCVW